MMIKKVDTSFVGGPRWQKPRISGQFWGSSHLSTSRYPPTHQTCRNSEFRCLNNIPPHFKQKFWQENSIWKKSKYPHWRPSSFQALFLAITSPSVKLAAFKVSIASVELPEHLKPLSASLTLIWGCLDTKQWSRTKFSQPTLFDPQPPLFYERTLFSSILAVGEAQKPDGIG